MAKPITSNNSAEAAQQVKQGVGDAVRFFSDVIQATRGDEDALRGVAKVIQGGAPKSGDVIHTTPTTPKTP